MHTARELFRIQSSAGYIHEFRGHRIAEAAAEEMDPDSITRKLTVTLYRTDGLLLFHGTAAEPSVTPCRYVSHAEYEYDEDVGTLPGGQDWYQSHFRTFPAAEDLARWLHEAEAASPALAECYRQAADSDAEVRRWHRHWREL